jgi:hypothetical protein
LLKRAMLQGPDFASRHFALGFTSLSEKNARAASKNRQIIEVPHPIYQVELLRTWPCGKRSLQEQLNVI